MIKLVKINSIISFKFFVRQFVVTFFLIISKNNHFLLQNLFENTTTYIYKKLQELSDKILTWLSKYNRFTYKKNYHNSSFIKKSIYF